MKNSNLYRHLLSIFLTLGIAPLLSSCDETPKPEKAESEKSEAEKSEPGKESTEEKAVVQTAQEAEGVEAAKDAIKKKDEEEAKDSEARKEKTEEKKSASDGAGRAPQGLFKKR